MDIEKTKLNIYGTLSVLNVIGEDKAVEEILSYFESHLSKANQRIEDLEKRVKLISGCPKCESKYIEYTEHEFYECGSCDHTWILME